MTAKSTRKKKPAAAKAAPVKAASVEAAPAATPPEAEVPAPAVLRQFVNGGGDHADFDFTRFWWEGGGPRAGITPWVEKKIRPGDDPAHGAARHVDLVLPRRAPGIAGSFNRPHVHVIVPSRELGPNGFGVTIHRLCSDSGQQEAWEAWKSYVDQWDGEV